jgi:hypothetical protein
MSSIAKTRVEAKVAGDALVVSCSDEGGAKVWRATLDNLSLAAFELRDAGAQTVLYFKTADRTEDIYAFASREGAVLGLRAVTGALFAHQATLTAGTAATPIAQAPKRGFFGRLFRGIFYIMLFVAALFLLMKVLAPAPTNNLPPQVSKQSGEPLQPGKPVPAEELFGK